MFNFYHEKRMAPPYLELKAEVHRIFELIKAGEYEPYTSLYTMREIDNEKNQEKRERMAALISEYGIKILDETDEAEHLATLYVQEKAISPCMGNRRSPYCYSHDQWLRFYSELEFYPHSQTLDH
jgi:hypothetical protein